MNISTDSPIDLSLSAQTTGVGRRTAADFDRIMAGMMESAPATSPDDVTEKTRIAEAQEAAEQLVSTVFIQPILAMVRDSVWSESGPFAPGATERRFGPLLDQHIADRIVSKSDFPLVEQVRDKMFGSKADADVPLEATLRSER